jgi:hypothetical protein
MLAHAGDMTTAPPFVLRARTAGEPEPDLTSIVVIHRAIRQDLRRLAACGARSPITAAADRASRALASFGAAPGTVAELHPSVSQLRDMPDEHIADEEHQILAAMRRYLPADAYRPHHTE